MRAMTSAKLTPDAATRMRTSPGPAATSGTSRSSSTSGGPIRGIQTERMGSARPEAEELGRLGASGDAPAGARGHAHHRGDELDVPRPGRSRVVLEADPHVAAARDCELRERPGGDVAADDPDHPREVRAGEHREIR